MFVNDMDILLSETENKEIMIGIINAPADKVWDLISDFDGTPKWIKAIVESDTINTEEGHFRILKLNTGGVVKEKLERIDEISMIQNDHQ